MDVNWENDYAYPFPVFHSPLYSFDKSHPDCNPPPTELVWWWFGVCLRPLWGTNYIKSGLKHWRFHIWTRHCTPFCTCTDLFRVQHTHSCTHTLALHSSPFLRSYTIPDSFYSSPFPLFFRHLAVSLPLHITDSSIYLPCFPSLSFQCLPFSRFIFCSLHSSTLPLSLCQVLYWALIGSLEVVETLSSD